MKPNLPLLFLLICLAGCGTPSGHQDIITEAYKDLEVDGCQYLVFYSEMSRTPAVVHKGNCNNPIHKK